MTFRGLSKVKSLASSYVPLRVKLLLSETFLSIGFNFRDIGLDHLKWDTLYTGFRATPCPCKDGFLTEFWDNFFLQKLYPTFTFWIIKG